MVRNVATEISELNPTQADLQDPLFIAIWQAIKPWDIQRSPTDGYAHATGTDAMTILNAIRLAPGALDAAEHTITALRRLAGAQAKLIVMLNAPLSGQDDMAVAAQMEVVEGLAVDAAAALSGGANERD